jgi:hypothetical protein
MLSPQGQGLAESAIVANVEFDFALGLNAIVVSVEAFRILGVSLATPREFGGTWRGVA